MSVSSTATVKKPLLSDQFYNVLKHVAAVGLPAVATLYFALAQIWHFPHAEQVLGTIASVNAFVGALVGFSTLTYNNSDVRYVGALDVTDNGLKKIYSLNLNATPEHLETLPSATFKVNPVQSVAPDPIGNPPTLGA